MYILQDVPLGSVLIGKIIYGKISSGNGKGTKNNEGCPASYQIVCVVPPPVKVIFIPCYLCIVQCGFLVP